MADFFFAKVFSCILWKFMCFSFIHILREINAISHYAFFRSYLKNPLLSSCSAKLLIEDIKTSSYPRKVLRINLEKESPKQVSLLGSKTTISTEIFNFLLVAGESLKNPYSKLYSTMYSSSVKKKEILVQFH